MSLEKNHSLGVVGKYEFEEKQQIMLVLGLNIMCTQRNTWQVLLGNNCHGS